MSLLVDRSRMMLETRPLPLATTCADCGVAIARRYGWCSLCAEAYCFACGRQHLCTSICEQNGCLAGLCIRLVADGALSQRWGLPTDD